MKKRNGFSKKRKSKSDMMPISTISSQNWWEVTIDDKDAVGGSAVATQTQCSSGGGGNGRCGSQSINRDGSKTPRQ